MRKRRRRGIKAGANVLCRLATISRCGQKVSTAVCRCMEADAGRVPETALGAPSLSGGSKDVVVVISNKPLALTALVLASIVGAYAVERRLQHFAGTALGHAIGVLGATLLLVVFFYPVRKYFLRRGSITEWLAWHMVLGIVGPLLVLMHGAFHFHALGAIWWPIRAERCARWSSSYETKACPPRSASRNCSRGRARFEPWPSGAWCTTPSPPSS
jgi:hypothetical protein